MYVSPTGSPPHSLSSGDSCCSDVDIDSSTVLDMNTILALRYTLILTLVLRYTRRHIRSLLNPAMY